MRLRYNKKAVSPLIASVLLISFAITIGVIIINWGTGFVTDSADDAADKYENDFTCKMDISLEVKTIQGIEKLCYNDTQYFVEFMLENNGKAKIEGIKVVIIDIDDSIETHDFEDFKIEQGSTSQKIQVNYSDTFNDLQFLEIVPLIKENNKQSLMACSANSLVVNNIPLCD